MNADLESQAIMSRKAWEDYANIDPLFYICTDPAKRGGKWSIQEFLDLGRREVSATLAIAQYHFNIENWNCALDLGCGAGRLTFALAEYFKEVIGIDIAAAYLEHARRIQEARGVSNIKFIKGNGYDLREIPDASVDFALSLLTLQHLPSRGMILNYLDEFRRVLSTGGGNGCANFGYSTYFIRVVAMVEGMYIKTFSTLAGKERDLPTRFYV